MPDNTVKGETEPGDPKNSGNNLEPSGPPDRMPNKKRTLRLTSDNQESKMQPD
ncbi:hypothetical protein E4U19_007863 [Claviceps sp. Clav32 group G5]|nr:hypothetical protein E4U19_007863 [Claviceps sp. Clav32 group G5]